MRITLLIPLLYVSFSACTSDEQCGGTGGKCDVQIGSAKYCSKCAGSRVPINGICRLQVLSRNICPGAINSSTASGTCTSCLRDFLLYRGGCYRDGTLLNYICKSRHIIVQGMYCGNCGIAGDIPINGECVPAEKAAGNTCADGVCTVCTNGYFHHYGSCYAYGGTVGINICSDEDASSTSPPVCEVCSSEFVKNPKASASNTSCLACYGLEGTLFCESCRINVLTDPDAKATLCTKCRSGFVPIDGRCTSIYSAEAALAGCSTSNGAENTFGLCSTCSPGYMLFYGSCYSVNGKIATAICAPENQIYLGGRVLCKKCAQKDYYPMNGLCSMNTNDSVCSDGMCTVCATDIINVSFLLYGGCYSLSSPIGQSLCTEASNGSCTACNTDATSGIVTNPDNTTADAPKCLACWDAGASGVDNCGQCSSATGENNTNKVTCNKCSDLTDPVENKCTLALPPVNPAGCAVDGCQNCASGSATVCSKCFPPLISAENGRKCLGNCKFLGSGFYNDSGVCKPCMKTCLNCNNDNTCSSCIEGYYLKLTSTSNSDPNGVCMPCSKNCNACQAEGESKCTVCSNGYYAAFNKGKGPGKCVTCNATENNYTGVQNCALCYSTTGMNGSKNVVCTRCEAGYAKKIEGGVSKCEKVTNCNVPLCEICMENDPNTCEHCGSGSYLIRSEGRCTKNCTEYNSAMYPDDDLQECQYCKIENCVSCRTGLLCANCSSNSVPISPDIYHTSCLGCSDTNGMYGWVGVPGCASCELTSAGSGPVNCLDPNYYRKSTLSGGGIAAIVIVVLILLAVVGFLVWWFLIRKGKNSKRGGGLSIGKRKYTTLSNVDDHEYRQSLI